MIEPPVKILIEAEANLVRKNKIVDESWDFKKANTKEYTHCFHAYPAMMIPQVARRLIENFGKNADIYLILTAGLELH